MSESFEDKIKSYKQKSPKHLQNWKKIKAIENFAKAHDDVNVWEELEFLIRIYRKGYLWEVQERLLDEMLAHYKIDYTKWAVKDGWVKMQLINGFKETAPHQQLEMWFDALERKKVDTRNNSPIYSKLIRHKLIHPRLSA